MVTPEQIRAQGARERLENGISPTIISNEIHAAETSKSGMELVLEHSRREAVGLLSENLPEEVVIILEKHYAGTPLSQNSMWAVLRRPYYMTKDEQANEVPPHHPTNYRSVPAAYAALGVHVALARSIMAQAAKHSEQEGGYDVVEMVKINYMKMDRVLDLKIAAKAETPYGEDVIIDLIAERRKVNQELLGLAGHGKTSSVKIKNEVNNTNINQNFNSDEVYGNFPVSGEDLEIIEATYSESPAYPNTIEDEEDQV